MDETFAFEGLSMDYDDWADLDYDPDRDCPRCQGDGKVPTADYESYFGAMHKPCPECNGDACVGEPPLS